MRNNFTLISSLPRPSDARTRASTIFFTSRCNLLWKSLNMVDPPDNTIFWNKNQISWAKKRSNNIYKDSRPSAQPCINRKTSLTTACRFMTNLFNTILIIYCRNVSIFLFSKISPIFAIFSYFVILKNKITFLSININFTLYSALLVSIGADWIHLSITSGRELVSSLLYISGLKKTCTNRPNQHQDICSIMN